MAEMLVKCHLLQINDKSKWQAKH